MALVTFLSHLQYFSNQFSSMSLGLFINLKIYKTPVSVTKQFVCKIKQISLSKIKQIPEQGVLKVKKENVLTNEMITFELLYADRGFSL
jgi:hypothetical protein